MKAVCQRGMVMSLVFEFGIILAVCLAGELLHALLPLPVPASIYGLCLLLLLLLTGVVKEKHIARAAGFLLSIMSLLFVPAAAGILSVWDEAKRLLLPLAVAIVPVTIGVMAATGLSVQVVQRRGRKGK